MKKKIIITCALALTISASYFYGLASHKYYLAPFPQLLSLKNHIFPESIGYSDMSSRTQVPCSTLKGKKMMVALAFGQSNSGNHGETLFKPRKGVYNFFKGRCYVAEDPLLGPTGDRGSLWTRLGELLVSRGMYDKVIVIPIGVGSTVVAEWSVGGYLHPRIVRAVNESKAAGLKITHIFWVQGGSEKRTKGDTQNKANYKNDFLKMLKSIRAQGVRAPAYVAVSTSNGTDNNLDIEEAQRELADPHNNIYRGPDDDILYADRSNAWETVHLSAKGLDKCAAAWFEVIRKAENR